MIELNGITLNSLKLQIIKNQVVLCYTMLTNNTVSTVCPSLTSTTSSHPLQLFWRRLTWSFVSFIAVCYSMWPYKHQRFNWLNARWQSRLLTWIWLLMNTYSDVEKNNFTLVQAYSRSKSICIKFSFLFLFCCFHWTFIFFPAIGHLCDRNMKMYQCRTKGVREEICSVYL